MEPAQAWKDVLNAMRYNLDIYWAWKAQKPCTGYFDHPFTNQPICASEKRANHRVQVTTISHPSCSVYWPASRATTGASASKLCSKTLIYEMP
jgi:hypothetical protein